MVETTPAPAQGAQITPAQGFEILCRNAQKAGPEAQKRLAAHIRAIMGRPTLLPVYHNDPNISGEDKIRLYSLCVRAILTKNWSLLQGQDALGAGAAGETPRIDPATTVAAPQPAPQPQPVPQPAPPTPPTPPEPAPPPPEAPKAPELPRVTLPVADRMSPIARAIFEEIAPFLPKPEDKPIDAETVRKIADEVFTHQINNGGFPEDRVKKLVEEASGVDEDLVNELIKSALDKHSDPRLLVLTQPSGQTATFTEDVHWQYDQLLAWLNANVPVWAWGGGGGGKTHLMYQLAKGLNLKPYIVSVDPTMTVGKLQGYRNLSTGEFVEGLLYKPFKEGGLLGMDEIDIGDPGILGCLNAAISNDFFMFPNGEVVPKHPTFRVLAGANTKGAGATAGYTARQKLDAATLDRFAIIEVVYDEELETALSLGRKKQNSKVWKLADTNAEERAAQCERWVQYVQKARKAAGTSVLISPRASILGCRAIRAGIPLSEVADALLFKLCCSTTRSNIISYCGSPR